LHTIDFYRQGTVECFSYIDTRFMGYDNTFDFKAWSRICWFFRL